MPPHTGGGYRNHCPLCLYSRHLDERPGDRAHRCGGPMAPIAIEYRPAKGYLIVHRCGACGTVRRNRIATGTVAPDDLNAIIALMAAGRPE